MSGFVPEPSPNVAAENADHSLVNDKSAAWNYQFFYNPSEWSLNAEGELVPTISHISKHPGAGLDENGDFTPVVVKLGKRGWKPIPHQVLGPGTDYVTPYKTRSRTGRVVHRSVFQTPYQSPDGSTHWRHDSEAWRAFLKLLRKRGTIEAPRPEIVQGILEQRYQVRDLLAKRRPSTENELLLEKYERKVRLNEQAIRNLEAELEESYKVYGKPVAPARNRLLELLREEEEEEALLAPSAPAAPAAPSTPPTSGFTPEAPAGPKKGGK